MKQRPILFWLPGGLVLILAALGLIFYHPPISLHVRNAESGGFTPDYLQVRLGQPLRLRLISEDVQHSFAVGNYPMQPILLQPHQPVDVTLTFDQPGSYTFYTTLPSSLNFWRMRGTIEVSGDQPEATSQAPMYVQLGFSLDDEHAEAEDPAAFPARPPSAARAALNSSLLDPAYLDHAYYPAHSPLETFEELRAQYDLSDADSWDLVAYIWANNTSAQALAAGQQLYQTDCAACHGETGAGDGLFADQLKALAEQNTAGMGMEAPTDFSQPEHLLGSSPAVVQGLILRGGMGTGMPMWGDIFSDDQTWDLVAYLYSFQMDIQPEVR